MKTCAMCTHSFACRLIYRVFQLKLPSHVRVIEHETNKKAHVYILPIVKFEGPLALEVCKFTKIRKFPKKIIRQFEATK